MRRILVPNSIRRQISLASLFSVMIWAYGCASSQGVYPSQPIGEGIPKTPQAETGGMGFEYKEYMIGPDDELEIKFPDRQELNETVKVRPDGKISLPFIGTIQAGGKSPEELQTEITRLYQEIAGIHDSDISPAEKRYAMSVGDELEIKFPYHQGMDQTVKVRPDGKISLSLVNTIEAEGKSPEELEVELNRRYLEYLERPELVVVVKSFSNSKITVNGRAARGGMQDIRPLVIVRNYAPLQIYVGGEVAKPGVFNYRGSLTAMQAIIEAGGSMPGAEMRSVLVLRKVNVDQPIFIRRDLKADQSGRLTNDIFLHPFDVVIVPKTGIASVGEFMDQLMGVLPPLQNISFGFVYNLTPETTIRTVP